MSHLNAGPADYLIITSAPFGWRELSALTDPPKAEYARRHGHHFVADVSDIYEMNTGMSIRGFVKLDLILRYLDSYKAVFWFDCDLLVTNMNIRLEDLFDCETPGGVHLGYDANGFHSTVIAAFNEPLVKDYIWAANNAGRSMFLKHPWHEMEALRYFSMTPPYDQLVCYHSVKEFCPILKSEYVKYGLPLDIGAEYGWEEGDFALHLSALSLERRIELATEFSKKIVR